MAFKDTYRLEKVYYENIWTLLKLLKNVDKNNVDMGTVKELLDNAIADNESIIIIYKNLGELYAELQNQHMELGKELEKLRESLEEFKDEINDKIDENHNYIMGLIREIEQRLDDLENRVEDLEERMTQAETDIDSLEGRMTTAEGDIDNLETAVDGLKDDLTALEGRVDTAEGDIDDLEQNKQDKLTAGSGIAIDPNTNEITNTAQGKIYTAGSGISIDPDTNEISATGGNSSYPLNTLAQLHYQQFNSASTSETNGTFINTDTTSKLVNKVITNDTLKILLSSGLRHGGGVSITDGKHIIGNVDYMITLTFLIDGSNKNLVLSGNMLKFDINTNQEYGLIFEKEFYFNFSGVKGCKLKYITLNKYGGCVDTDDSLLTLNGLANDVLKNLKIEIYN